MYGSHTDAVRIEYRVNTAYFQCVQDVTLPEPAPEDAGSTTDPARPSDGKHPKKPLPKNSRPSDRTLHLKLESKQLGGNKIWITIEAVAIVLLGGWFFSSGNNEAEGLISERGCH